MDYKKLITEELANRNWDEIIKLATKAKNSEFGEVFLGIRKGCVNLFTGYNYRIEKMFEKAGIKVFTFRTQPALNKSIKSGELSLDLINNQPIVIFALKATVSAKIGQLHWPICNFTLRSSSKKNTKKKNEDIYDHFCTLTNKSTNESINFKIDDEDIALTAIIRDKRIDSILDDL